MCQHYTSGVQLLLMAKHYMKDTLLQAPSQVSSELDQEVIIPSQIRDDYEGEARDL